MTTNGMQRWHDAVALVTGASSGIGAAVARELSGAGLRVVLAARREDRIAALATEFPGGDERVLPLGVDLRDEGAILAMFETVRSQWGGVDVLINNAGLGHKAPLLDGETAMWREMLEVNILALCVCTREAVRDMRRRDIGQVIHISSMSAHRVPPGSGVYSATKFAVRSLTEGLRSELRAASSGIRVAAVSPGYVETEFVEKYHRSADVAHEIFCRFPMLQPEDIAATVIHILSQPDHVEVHDVLLRATAQPT